MFLFQGIKASADSCDEAGEWYDEGLHLSDNSDQEAFYYQRAIDLCPEFIAAHNRLGEVYKNQGKYILSLEQYEQARIKAFSSSHFSSRAGSRALFLDSVISLGEIYRLQGKYKQAAEEFSKALQMDPDSLAAQNNLQYVYKRMHSYDDVLSPNNRLLVNAIFTRMPGLTLPENTFSFDLQYKTWDQTAFLTLDMFEDDRIILNPDLTPGERKATIKAAIVSMRYGLTNDLTIGLIPKYFSRKLGIQLDAFGVLAAPEIDGLGDTEFLLKYHIWGERNRHLSLYTLFNIPTGQKTQVVGDTPLTQIYYDKDGNLITHVWEFKRFIPFGSESYDITPGLAFTLGLNPFILHANMQYRFTDGKQIGDEFLFNCAGVYRLHPSVNATMEMNYRWRGDVEREQHIITYKLRPDEVGYERIPAGALVLETNYTEFGGHSLFLSPGIQFTITQGVRAEFGMQIPVIRQAAGWTEDIVYQLGVTFMTF